MTTENDTRILIQEELAKLLERECPMKHKVMTSEINACMQKKLNTFLWRIVAALATLNLAAIIIAKLL